MTGEDLLLKLLARFREEGVEYVLVGGQAVRLNDYREKDVLDKQVLRRIKEGLKVDPTE